MRRVPVVVAGSGSLAARVAERVDEVRVDLAGFEGFLLELADGVGPEPSVLVDTGGAFDAMVAAVEGGHAAATADLATVVRHPVELAVLRSDRRLGLSGALLPGLPLVDTLTRHVDAGDAVHSVELTGDDPEALADESVAVCAIVGVELTREHVRIEPGGGPGWRALVGDRFPVVAPYDAAEPRPAPVRTATIRTARTGPAGVTLRGAVGGDERTADALLADVLAFAREIDTPWRVHRRRVARVR